MITTVNKEIENDAPIATIEYIDGIDSDTKNTLDGIINDCYIEDDCDYVLQLNDCLHYKGDFCCLCSLADLIFDKLKRKQLQFKIKKFDVYDEKKDLYANAMEALDFEAN